VAALSYCAAQGHCGHDGQAYAFASALGQSPGLKGLEARLGGMAQTQMVAAAMCHGVACKGGQVVQWRVGQWAQLTQVIWQCLSTLCVVDGTGVVGVHPLVLVVVMGLGRRARMGWEPRWIAYAEVWGTTRTCKNWH